MPATLTVRDETTTGQSFEAITLEFLTDHITVRELIRERVYQEVKDFNAGKARDELGFSPAQSFAGEIADILAAYRDEGLL